MHNYKKSKPNPKIILDNYISAKTVRLIDENKANLGTFDLTEIIKEAHSKDQNIIQISEGEIPVCMMINLNYFLYKKNKDKKSVKTYIKEIKIQTKTDLSDMLRKLSVVMEFLGPDQPKNYSGIITGRKQRTVNVDVKGFINSYFVGKNIDVKCPQTVEGSREIKFYLNRKK